MSTNGGVFLRIPNGTGGETTVDLDEAVRNAILKAEILGEPVGFGGHALTCPAFDYEAGSDCQTCENAWGLVCIHGLPQSPYGTCSELFNTTYQFCPQYDPKELECDCSFEDRLPKVLKTLLLSSNSTKHL